MVWGDEAQVGPTHSTLYFLPYYLILHLYLMMCCILYAVLLYDCSGWINLSLMHHGLKAFLFPVKQFNGLREALPGVCSVLCVRAAGVRPSTLHAPSGCPAAPGHLLVLHIPAGVMVGPEAQPRCALRHQQLQTLCDKARLQESAPEVAPAYVN